MKTLLSFKNFSNEDKGTQPASNTETSFLLRNKSLANKFYSSYIYYRLNTLLDTSSFILKSHGASGFFKQLFRFIKGERQNTVLSHTALNLRNSKNDYELYKEWMQKNGLDNKSIEYQRKSAQKLNHRPLISIITPVFNTDPLILEKMIESVLAQTYPNWELCLADGGSTDPQVISVLRKYAESDPRLKIKLLKTNLGIAENSNQALSLSSGKFIALLDHDDELSVDALYENVLLLNQSPDADIIYSDEDKLDFHSLRCDPHFKPDWSPDLFCSTMYTCHLGVYRKTLVEEIGGFRSKFDGAQDYDLVLRLIEKTNNIHHIPKILYHWRKGENSTAAGLKKKDYAKAAQMKAVSEHFKRCNISAEVRPGLAENLLRVKRLIKDNPKVSIIIPTRDKVELLKNCLASIESKTTYGNYEILVVDNSSEETATLEYLDEISRKKNIKVISYDFPFNFAAINNFAVDYASGEILLFLNNDTEIISSEWLEAMVEHSVRPEVGAVGARLLYTDGTIQHAGVIIGIGGIAGHSHKYISQDHPGYFSRAKAIQNLSAVTGACMMVRKEIFKSLGGFDEQNLAVAFNDIDFCLRLRQKDLLIVYTPYAEIYHHESVSRGSDKTPKSIARYQLEVDHMLKLWINHLQKDPYYNIHLTLVREDFSIKQIF